MLRALLVSSLLFTVPLVAQTRAAPFSLLNAQSPPSADNPFLIENAEDLKELAEAVNTKAKYTLNGESGTYREAHYRLANDISLSGQNNFTPIGTQKKPFMGVFDGNGQSIIGLAYTGDSIQDVGLFGEASRAKIYDLMLSEPMITNNYSKRKKNFSVGALVGTTGLRNEISNVTILGGAVTGVRDVGALVGSNSGMITGSSATGEVSGSKNIGGLVGDNYRGTINASTATGAVTGDEDVGGLVGDNHRGRITASAATGDVTGISAIGGLVGNNLEGLVTGASATGAVTGEHIVGGLVGYSRGAIAATFATGTVTGDRIVGGLVGSNDGRIFPRTMVPSNSSTAGGYVGLDYIGTVRDSYATGVVTGTQGVGGLVGQSGDGTVTNSYWDEETSGQDRSDGGTKYTTAQLQDPSSYTGIYVKWKIDINRDWNTDDPWIFSSPSQYPVLNTNELNTLDWSRVDDFYATNDKTARARIRIEFDRRKGGGF